MMAWLCCKRPWKTTETTWRSNRSMPVARRPKDLRAPATRRAARIGRALALLAEAFMIQITTCAAFQKQLMLPRALPAPLTEQ